MIYPGPLIDGPLVIDRRAGRLALATCTRQPFELLELSGHSTAAFAGQLACSDTVATVAGRFVVAARLVAAVVVGTCSGRRVG